MVSRRPKGNLLSLVQPSYQRWIPGLLVHSTISRTCRKERPILIYAVCLCLLTTGDVTTISLLQPVSVLASLGSATQISCTLSGGTMATYTISWFQHQQPNPPKYLLYYKDGSNQRKKAGVSDRFAASKDASLNACYLTISGVQAADEGTYYCLASTGSEYHCVTHSGAKRLKP